MDVDRIQKINALALELLKQGMASDRQDAVNQAERIYKGDVNASFREPVQQEARQSASSSVTNASTSDLPPEKVREILDQNTKFLVKTIKEFQEQMKSMEQEIITLKTKMTYSRPAESAPQATASSSSTISKQQALQGGPAADSSNPRSGQFKQADVSIEKIFYMGNKR